MYVYVYVYVFACVRVCFQETNRIFTYIYMYYQWIFMAIIYVEDCFELVRQQTTKATLNIQHQ